jgi:hypothetical protein
MAEYDIEIMDARANATTGHVEVDVCAVEENDGSIHRGPKRTYGIDATQLKVQYNNDVSEWLNKVKRDHQAHHGLHVSLIGTLNAMKGKRL